MWVPTRNALAMTATIGLSLACLYTYKLLNTIIHTID
jgi:hypothetical protein